MGNSKSQQLTPGSLKQAERQLLEFSGLSESEYEVRKVFTCDDESCYMTTIIVADSTKPTLVLVHGFAGSGTLYYKVMAGLAQNFNLIVIDLVGMGSSARPTWTCRNGQEADTYFIEAIEKWRINMGNLTNFYIAAHSYGGYLFGTYASQYPQHVRKLVLLSPLGTKQRPENWTLSKTRFARGNGPPGWAVSIASTLWGTISPFSILKLRSEAKVREMLNGYIDRHQPVSDEREKACLQEYLFQILLRDTSTQIALFQQHDAGLHAHSPLCSPEKLLNEDLPFPVSFIYGKRDWMDSRGSREIVKANRFFSSGESQLHLLPNAGHQLFMGNPQGFIEILTADLLGNIRGRYQIAKYTNNYVDDEGNLTHTDTEYNQMHADRTQGEPVAQEEEEKKGPRGPRLQKQKSIWDTREDCQSARNSVMSIEPQKQERLAAQVMSSDNDAHLAVEGNADPFGEYGSEVDYEGGR